MKKTEGVTTAFQMSLDNAILFYHTCKELDLNTEKQRVELLYQMAKQGQIDRIWSTKRSREQFVSDMAKHFNVARITKSGDKK